MIDRTNVSLLTADMTAATVDTTYHRFSRDSEYVRANAAYVDRLPLEEATRILDLACGNGAVGRLLLARAPRSSLAGVDRDPIQIDLAAQEYADLGYLVHRIDCGKQLDMSGSGRSVNLMVGAVEDLELPARTFDFANIANAIHLIGDKVGLLRSVAHVVEPGGHFAFSSGFYAGCWPAVTQQVYYEWVKGATAWIAGLSAQRVAAGETAIKRVRGKSQVASVAYQNRWLTPDEWRVVLAETAQAALDAAGVERVQHNWIEVCARRTG